MAASTRHVGAYLLRYRNRYPEATIIHVASSMFDTTMRPTAGRRRDLKPVLDAIEREVARSAASRSPPRILVHLFSNAGAYTTALLATTFERLFHAFTLPLASLPVPVRMIGTLLVVLGLAVVLGLQRMGVQDAVDWSRQVLNDTTMVNPQAPRLYLYSKDDEMVLSTDVEDHSNEAEARWIPVHRAVFEKSAHCRHVQLYRDEYWRAVDDILSTKGTGLGKTLSS
ncbi:hypothetical protein QBC46DRAFT_270861 [Diplogelasinospora grovesii]|uniref:Indole-diterpene biosynthesis protein PaxU n=1 Tax=Diplogelasinospora grovesii TaxID=303347 RepID=A0AAN6S112_9PEZI|nr:hypothetical protein QBC46DRAFT_270861 [Diplogelasinospora grovesii]